VRRFTEQRVYLIAATVVSFAFGLDLWFRGDRYGRTPSYANLMDFAPPHVWALAYVAVGLLCTAALWFRSNRVVVMLAHGVGMALLSWWLAAFVFRTVTDDATTAANVIAWSAYLFLITRSAQLVDTEPT
jgi:hypothetical protein